MHGYPYETSCVNSTGELITAMQEAARPITRRTFLKYAEPGAVERLEKDLGYDTGTERGGLRMSKDWHVEYAKSVYNGRPCVYVCHSRIEYIFTKQ